MTTLVFPLSRIEGHAQVSIETSGGDVKSAHFSAMELRGFEYLVKGVPAEQMPVIVPRICGVCATAHHVAAVKTLEDVYGVKVPPVAQMVRELLLLGQLIQNQATSLFIFTMPDRLGTTSIFAEDAEARAADQELAGLASHALQVRKAGTDLISLAGGQFIHPVKAVVGGVSSGIKPEAAAPMRMALEKALPIACDLFDAYWATSLALRQRIGTWGDDEPSFYISSTGEAFPRFNANIIYVMSPDGVVHDTFTANQFREHLTYQQTEYSYSGQTSYRGEILRANSLARINMTQVMGTHRANDYLANFQNTFGKPAHGILLFDLCRGIELVYAIERAIEILDHPLDALDTASDHTVQDGEGYGMVEAPRGPLIHHYVVQNGKIASAEFIIPTVHNMLAIERALKVAARRYINSERVNLELERAVGRVVRAFDPCIACATH
ncbi:MAG: Ni/Fe hydrogenase subunit alpha [Anaerolineales bacterium]|jgi:F420-non-reducing hydrogenase large subunit|nr:Ni/Fe hydrogenase subunit alpha [Anaerolineales bacterium]